MKVSTESAMVQNHPILMQRMRSVHAMSSHAGSAGDVSPQNMSHMDQSSHQKPSNRHAKSRKEGAQKTKGIMVQKIDLHDRARDMDVKNYGLIRHGSLSHNTSPKHGALQFTASESHREMPGLQKKRNSSGRQLHLNKTMS